MTEAKPRELHLLTTEIANTLGPIATLFPSAQSAEEAAGMIKRSNNPTVLHLIEKSAYTKAVKALRHYALANGGNHPSGNVARNCLKDLGESNG